MALLWVDGFEKYGTGNGVAVSPSTIVRWKYISYGETLIDVYDGRWGGHCVAIDSTGSSMTTPDLSPQSRTLITGFNFKLDSVNNLYPIVDLIHPQFDGATSGYQGCRFQVASVNGDNQIAVKTTVIRDTTTTVNLQADQWYHFEAKVYCDDTNGTVNMKIDGVEVMSFTGNTRHRAYQASDRYSLVRFYSPTIITRLYVDDFYVMDDTGNTCNDFLGAATRVATLSPTSDASGNWTPSTGVDMYAVVDEDDLDAAYIEDTTSGNQAVFEVTDLTATEATGTVQGIMASCDSQQTSNSNKYAKFISSNGAGSIENTGNFAPGNTNPLCHTQIMETDPDGNAWSPSTINSLRVGVEVSS